MSKVQSERIISLDLLRGFFLVVIVIDHLFRFPSLFEIFTGRGQLWVSAAEGFFIISGLLIGYIYKKGIIDTPRAVFLKIWKRAAKLYLLSIGLTMIFTAWGWVLNSPDVKMGIWPIGVNPPLMFIRTFSLQYVYGWADFLPFYAVFMFFAPLALWLIAKRQTLLVAFISIAIWFFRNNNFYLSWQILFVAGIISGFYFSKLEDFFMGLTQTSREIIKVTLFSIASVTILTSVFFVFGIWTIFRAPWVLNLPHNILEPLVQAKDWYFPLQTAWFDKATLPPIRLFLSGLWFSALLVLFRKNEQWLVRLFKGLFLKFGQNSLLVYVIHGFILFPSFKFLPGGTNFLVNTVIDAVVVSLIYMVVIWHKKFIEILMRWLLQTLVFLGVFKLDLLGEAERD